MIPEQDAQILIIFRGHKNRAPKSPVFAMGKLPRRSSGFCSHRGTACVFGFPNQQQDSDCDQNCRAQASLESIHIIKEEGARTVDSFKDADGRGAAAVGQAEDMELHIVPGGMETARDPEIAVPSDQQAQKDAEQEHVEAKYSIKAVMEHIQFVVEYEEGAAFHYSF